jgi:hypothetical protein
MNQDNNNQEPNKIYRSRFSWLRIGKVVLVVVLVAAAAAGVWLLVISRPVKIAWASVIHNRRENYLTCQEFPFFPQVQKAFAKHDDVVTKIKAIPGVMDFKPELDKCYNFTGGMEFYKGQAVLEYNSRAARDSAEKLIGKDFFSIPYIGEPVK